MSRTDTYFAKGNVSVITGASSGIGRAAARYCAKKGMKVFMADIDEKELALAVAEVSALAPAGPADVMGVTTDVADEASVINLKEKAFAATGSVHVLMNNAGIGRGGGPLSPKADFDRTFGVNTWGPVNGCRAFVPAMEASGQPGLIINTGSKQGITCPPGNLIYNMTKAALKCYTEGLEHELRSKEGNKLSVALLVPGWVNTSIALKSQREQAQEKGEAWDDSKAFFSEAKAAKGAWMPDQVVDFMLDELNKGRFYIMCPDNDVDQETDKLRMTWALRDVIEDRPPLSRWHPEYKDKFEAFLAENKTKK